MTEVAESGLPPDGCAKFDCAEGLGVGDNDQVDEVSLATGCTTGVCGQRGGDLVCDLPFKWIETIWMRYEAWHDNTVGRVRSFDSVEFTHAGYKINTDIAELLCSKEHLKGDRRREILCVWSIRTESSQRGPSSRGRED